SDVNMMRCVRVIQAQGKRHCALRLVIVHRALDTYRIRAGQVSRIIMHDQRRRRHRFLNQPHLRNIAAGVRQLVADRNRLDAEVARYSQRQTQPLQVPGTGGCHPQRCAECTARQLQVGDTGTVFFSHHRQRAVPYSVILDRCRFTRRARRSLFALRPRRALLTRRAWWALFALWSRRPLFTLRAWRALFTRRALFALWAGWAGGSRSLNSGYENQAEDHRDDNHGDCPDDGVTVPWRLTHKLPL